MQTEHSENDHLYRHSSRQAGRLLPTLRGCKLHGLESFKACVWSSSVVVSPPVCDDLPGMAVAGEQVFVEALITEAPDEALHQAVLHELARSDVVPLHSLILLPSQHDVGSELGAVVGNHQQGRARRWAMLSSSLATRPPVMELSTTVARHSRVKSSMTQKTRKRRLSIRVSDAKSTDQH